MRQREKGRTEAFFCLYTPLNRSKSAAIDSGDQGLSFDRQLVTQRRFHNLIYMQACIYSIGDRQNNLKKNNLKFQRESLAVSLPSTNHDRRSQVITTDARMRVAKHAKKESHAYREDKKQCAWRSG